MKSIFLKSTALFSAAVITLSAAVCGLPASAAETAGVAAIGAEKNSVSAPKNLTASSVTTNSVTMSWSKASGAAAYIVYRCDSSGKYTKLAEVKSTKYKVTKLKPGKEYTFCVASAVKSGKTYAAKAKSAKYAVRTRSSADKLPAPAGLRVSGNSGSSVSLRWNSVKGADSYRVYYYDSAKKKFVKFTDTAKTSCKVTGLESGRKYKFKVASLKKTNGKTAIQDTSGIISGTTAYSVENAKLSNPNADENTKAVYSYICKNFGKKILAGQQESTWINNNPNYEMELIEDATGKLPAIRGLDFMNDDFEGVVNRAKAWWNKGGIVTICWHTGIDSNGSDGYQTAKSVVADWDKLLDKNTQEYKAMEAYWDKAGAALAELRDAGVPVLWRPFHEFDGDFFWWAKDSNGNKTEDGTNFKKLWKLMYDHYTNDLGLTNLIWVLGYGGTVKENWYPGDEYVDVIGSDCYTNDTYTDKNGNTVTTGSTNKNGWDRLRSYATTTKPMALHECGLVSSVDKLKSDNTLWSWFMVWHTDFLKPNVGKRFGENFRQLYNSDLVITLDELPDFC